MDSTIKASISIAIVVTGLVFTAIGAARIVKNKKNIESTIEKEVETEVNIATELKEEVAQDISTPTENLKLAIRIISSALLRSAITFFYISIIGACISPKYWNPRAVCITVPVRTFIGLFFLNRILLMNFK